MSDTSLRNHILALLTGGQAFDSLDDILDEFSPEQRGVVPSGAEHSAWQILEHMRRALRDILDYSQNENGTYVEKDWPADYWPRETLGDWEETLRLYKRDLAELEQLVATKDLFAPFVWEEKHTLLRQALLAADHAAYHLGELVMLRRWIG